jgi:hypothetical protein
VGVWLSGGKAAVAYHAIAGTSLVIDLIDIVQRLVGDGDLLNRWS